MKLTVLGLFPTVCNAISEFTGVAKALAVAKGVAVAIAMLWCLLTCSAFWRPQPSPTESTSRLPVEQRHPRGSTEKQKTLN